MRRAGTDDGMQRVRRWAMPHDEIQGCAVLTLDVATRTFPGGIDSSFRNVDARGDAVQELENGIGTEQIGSRIAQQIQGQFLAIGGAELRLIAHPFGGLVALLPALLVHAQLLFGLLPADVEGLCQQQLQTDPP